MSAIRSMTWLMIALGALACSGWYFAGSSPLIKLDEHVLSTTTDTIITQLTVRQFDTEGRLLHYLHTPLMQHIPFNNTHQLTTPHIIVAQLNQPPWEIHAKEAIALHGGQEITFKKDVIIHKKQDGNMQETTLKTEEITYFPKNKLATTPKDVLFTQSGNQVQSTGMNAYLAENRVQLLSNARGTYVSSHG